MLFKGHSKSERKRIFKFPERKKPALPRPNHIHTHTPCRKNLNGKEFRDTGGDNESRRALRKGGPFFFFFLKKGKKVQTKEKSVSIRAFSFFRFSF